MKLKQVNYRVMRSVTPSCRKHELSEISASIVLSPYQRQTGIVFIDHNQCIA